MSMNWNILKLPIYNAVSTYTIISAKKKLFVDQKKKKKVLCIYDNSLNHCALFNLKHHSF